jgi:arylsulfatase A-like enzyme
MKRNRNHPFFCYLSWGPPHQPYHPPRAWDRYDPAKLDFRPNVPAELRNDSNYRKWVAGYYGSCSALDHEMGRLLRAVEENGLAENTLLVFSADHGDMLGSHGVYYKSKPEEESLHIPLYMCMPGRIRAKQTVRTLASSIDLTPTILSICGLRPYAGITGKDLSGAVLGREPNVDFIYAQGAMTHGKAAAVRQSRDPRDIPTGVAGGKEWRTFVTPTQKLVVTIDNKVAALFDLEKDPYEMKNLAGERNAAGLERDLLARMLRWAKEVGDPFPEQSQPAKPMYTDEEAAQAGR